jgi:hypothetical protein
LPALRRESTDDDEDSEDDKPLMQRRGQSGASFNPFPSLPITTASRDETTAERPRSKRDVNRSMAIAESRSKPYENTRMTAAGLRRNKPKVLASPADSKFL